MRYCAILGALLATLGAEEPINEVTILVEVPSATAGVSQPATVPVRRGSTEDLLWKHPDQTFVDSNLGPLPIYTETVYDAAGMPAPRFPDAISKRFFDNPTEENALLYLETQKARVRRYLEASEMLQRTATKHGYVTPKDFMPPETAARNNRSLAKTESASPESVGSPAFGPAQARAAGLAKDQVPVVPGNMTAKVVEVIYIWDHRCPFSLAGYPDFAKVGKESHDRQLGPRYLTINLDNDIRTVQAQLDFLDYRHDGVTKFIENYTDITNLRSKLNVTETPVYVFIDRRSGKIRRLNGQQSADAIRQAVLDLVDHGSTPWSKAEPAWFRRVDPIFSETATGAATSERSTPALPPTRLIKAWDPDGGE